MAPRSIEHLLEAKAPPFRTLSRRLQGVIEVNAAVVSVHSAAISPVEAMRALRDAPASVTEQLAIAVETVRRSA